MTKNFNVKKIAVIGGGPGGLAALYEFLHTNKDGSSTVGKEKAADPAFEKIVVFEQKDKAGGIWASDVEHSDPLFLPQELLDTESYNDPDVIHPEIEQPSGLTLENSYDSPLVLNENRKALEWSSSGIYAELFTNIPTRFTRFSYLPDEEKYHDESRVIYPFLTHQELSQRLYGLIERENLSHYIRTNTRVEKVQKNEEGQWVITAKRKEQGKEYWYQEEFDAVVVANGHYTVPNIPRIEGLAEYHRANHSLLLHAKSYRDRNIFKDKKVLVVGNSISSANLLQYIFPLAGETYLSKRSRHIVFPWIETATQSKGIKVKPAINRFIPETKEVEFTDSTTVKDFDVILFTTGYHYHYPFLKDILGVVEPSNLSRVSGLYLNTFSLKDPTLAVTGVAISHLNFHTIETSAAAIAGVWSNVKALPHKEELQAWEEDHKKSTGDNLLFHFYPPEKVRDFINELSPYFPRARPDPLSRDEPYLMKDMDLANARLEKLFYDLKDGRVAVTDTVNVK
ncbi:Piso0_003683 [Millerozyma farinosa CBS 7064]|uniref:Piso0_003683 protein n=1 Tax=Pichia sorbitophila (strain ATCC MYA-4447 / BCRC 22081 / CBS 7064 / NBRC 10061 / NRRL Y-12695) TaxID=559304 RepID=G8YAQ7_PICSO|nr:Piso0_003683 [Millerozyma farinosa CBS 7064]CCE84142.1 Piso0_003683 [Millerozyma farinosa CBS 7064]